MSRRTRKTAASKAPVVNEEDEVWLRGNSKQTTFESSLPGNVEKEKGNVENEQGEFTLIHDVSNKSSNVVEEEVIILGEYIRRASSTPTKRKRRSRSFILSPSDSIFNESFEKVEKSEKPEGVVVVRKKEERRKLQGHECTCCEKYYDSLNLDTEERAKRVNAVSRHRSTYKPFVRAKTPDHFWDVDMPSSQEMYDRGYMKRIRIDKDEAKRQLF